MEERIFTELKNSSKRTTITYKNTSCPDIESIYPPKASHPIAPKTKIVPATIKRFLVFFGRNKMNLKKVRQNINKNIEYGKERIDKERINIRTIKRII